MAGRLQDEIKQSKPFGSLQQEAVLSMARTTAVLTRAWEQFLRGYGITLTQYNVLRILRGAGPGGLCRHEVASRLVTEVPDVSRLLDRMMHAGLLTRTRGVEDRRMVKACITDRGLAILEELDRPSFTLPQKQMAHMTETDLRTLIQLLDAARSSPAA